MRLSLALRSLNWARSWLFLALTRREAQIGEQTRWSGRIGAKSEPQCAQGFIPALPSPGPALHAWRRTPACIQ